MLTCIDRAALKAAGAADAAAFLCEGARSGSFALRSGSPPSDPQEGVFVVSTTPGYYWERIYSGPLDVKWFGAKNDNSADARPGIQAAVELAYALGSSLTDGACGSVWGGTGCYRLDSSVLFHKSINFYLEGYAYYTPTSGSAFVVGDVFDSHCYGYDIVLGGIKHVSGNTAAPTGWNMSGAVGLEIRKAQASKFRVKNIDCFTKYGLWLNSSNNVFSGQHVQGNKIEFGYIDYCGKGIQANSSSAGGGAAQTNFVAGDNLITNFAHFDLGSAGDTNCNHFQIKLGAMESPASGGTALRVFGYDNDIEIGYLGLGTSVQMLSGGYNTIRFLREKSQVTYWDGGAANKAFFADQTTTP